MTLEQRTRQIRFRSSLSPLQLPSSSRFYYEYQNKLHCAASLPASIVLDVMTPPNEIGKSRFFNSTIVASPLHKRSRTEFSEPKHGEVVDQEKCPFFLMGKCRFKKECHRSHELENCVYCGSLLPTSRVGASAHLSRCWKKS